jgi:DNA-binding transcriptional regulator YiaG
MSRSFHQLSPATTITEVQQSFSFSDEHLAKRFGVPVGTIQDWRQGMDRPSHLVMKQMHELLRLDEALRDARSGKYRRA